MNEYIFYTTEGHTFAPLENKIIENYQILGTEFGHNIDDSKKTFLNNNTWIKESGFNPEEIISMQVFTNDIKQDIQKVIQFLMNNNQILPKTSFGMSLEQNTQVSYQFL